MPVFEIETPDGKFEIEANSEEDLNTFLSDNVGVGPETEQQEQQLSGIPQAIDVATPDILLDPQKEEGLLTKIQKPGAASRGAIFAAGEEILKQRELPAIDFSQDVEPSAFGAVGRKIKSIIMGGEDVGKTLKQLADEERKKRPGAQEQSRRIEQVVEAAKVGAKEGFMNPETVPFFQDLAREATIRSQDLRQPPKTAAGAALQGIDVFGQSGGGFILDTLTDPLTAIFGIATGTAQSTIRAIASKPGGMKALETIAKGFNKIPGSQAAKTILFGDMLAPFKPKPPQTTDVVSKFTVFKKLQRKKQDALVQLNKTKDDIVKLNQSEELASGRTARVIKKRITQLERRASKKYGEVLDGIIENIDSPITSETFSGFLDDAITKINNLDLPENKAQIELLRKAKEFKLRFQREVDLVDDAGKTVKQLMPTDEVLQFKKDILNFKKEFANVARRGTGVDRLVLHNFDAEFGQFLQDAGVVGLEDLNAQYAPVRRALNQLNKKFRPKSAGGEFDLGGAKQVVSREAKRRAGLAKGDLAEKELINFLEKGDAKGFVSGKGKILSTSEDLAQRIKIITDNDPTKAAQIADDVRVKLATMEKELAKLKPLLETEKVIKNARKFEQIQRQVNRLERNKKLIVGALRIAAGATIGGAVFGVTGKISGDDR